MKDINFLKKYALNYLSKFDSTKNNLEKILKRKINRVNKDKTLNILSTLSISGYAIPGVILAVAFITFIAWFDESVIKTYGFLSIKKVFIGSILGLVIVYFIDFIL